MNLKTLGINLILLSIVFFVGIINEVSVMFIDILENKNTIIIILDALVAFFNLYIFVYLLNSGIKLISKPTNITPDE